MLQIALAIFVVNRTVIRYVPLTHPAAESDDADREPLPRILGDPQPHRQVHDHLVSEVQAHDLQTWELAQLHALHISIYVHRVTSSTHLQHVLTRPGACENTKESSPESPSNLYTCTTLGISGCIYICSRGPEEKEYLSKFAVRNVT